MKALAIVSADFDNVDFSRITGDLHGQLSLDDHGHLVYVATLKAIAS